MSLTNLWNLPLGDLRSSSAMLLRFTLRMREVRSRRVARRARTDRGLDGSNTRAQRGRHRGQPSIRVIRVIGGKTKARTCLVRLALLLLPALRFHLLELAAVPARQPPQHVGFF